MPPAFLNSREDALLVWLVAIVGFAVYKNPCGISAAFLNVMRALAQPKLLLLFGSGIVYCGVAVYGAMSLDLWDTGALKETIYWFVGTGIVLVGEAVSHPITTPRQLARRVLSRVIAFTIVIEFVVNLYSFPLAVEFVLTLVVLVFAAMQTVANPDPSLTPVKKLIDGLLILLGLVYLAYFAARFAGDPGSLIAKHTAEDFLVGPLLAVTLIPFLLVVAWLSGREQERFRARWRTAH